MSQVKIFQREGRKYDDSRWGKVVLVLGESHYCADPKDATEDMTHKIFQWLFNPKCEHEGWMNTYTKFASALSGRKEDRLSSEKVWDEVIFYNYVQEPLTGPRTAPTKEMMIASEGAFMEILEHYRPDVVLAWGKTRLYDNLPDAGYQGEECAGVETWIYELSNGHRVRVMPVQHPASGFSPSEWYPIIHALLKS
ncbi:hypothetical protein IX308_000143 [Porphyromonas levii]|uniref:hypothetical protein n=1 Tax=Porphyromonas levii TaxID=28114 RepID=UPI001B8D8FF7|nr:hypothetical protein [Porphyromonas levii]MBR8769694.1 hypothetical protein [Porphyromonas levii]MBR8783985.1 hypothetical protein [Porphyromonas levii]